MTCIADTWMHVLYRVCSWLAYVDDYVRAKKRRTKLSCVKMSASGYTYTYAWICSNHSGNFMRPHLCQNEGQSDISMYTKKV
jgi:hypothetical protein